MAKKLELLGGPHEAIVQLFMCPKFKGYGMDVMCPTMSFCEETENAVLTLLDSDAGFKVKVFLDTCLFCRLTQANCHLDPDTPCDLATNIMNDLPASLQQYEAKFLVEILLLLCKVTGLNISHFRTSSLLSQQVCIILIWKGASLVCNNDVQFFDHSETTSTRIKACLPVTVKIFQTCHISYWFHKFPEMKNLVLRNGSLDIMQKARNNQFCKTSDASWCEEMPLVLFQELFVLCSFYIGGQVIEAVQRVMDLLKRNSETSNLHLMMRGGGSARDIAESGGMWISDYPSTRMNWTRVISPRLKKSIVTDVKKLLSSDENEHIQASWGNPRFLKRLESRRETAFRVKILGKRLFTY